MPAYAGMTSFRKSGNPAVREVGNGLNNQPFSESELCAVCLQIGFLLDVTAIRHSRESRNPGRKEIEKRDGARKGVGGLYLCLYLR
jgi:hypothetical protein